MDRLPIITLLDSRLVDRCLEAIRRGELVIFPTETIYGIGGSAVDDRVWEKLWKLKPDRTQSLTYLVANWEMAVGLIEGDIDRIRRVAEVVWPGPVTLVVEANSRISERFRSKDRSLGIRVPGIDRIREAIHASGVPWVHTSANLSGKGGIRNLRKLDEKVRASAGLVIDGKTTALGGESTVIDVRIFPIQLLRRGVLPESRIRELEGI